MKPYDIHASLDFRVNRRTGKLECEVYREGWGDNERFSADADTIVADYHARLRNTIRRNPDMNPEQAGKIAMAQLWMIANPEQVLDPLDSL